MSRISLETSWEITELFPKILAATLNMFGAIEEDVTSKFVHFAHPPTPKRIVTNLVPPTPVVAQHFES